MWGDDGVDHIVQDLAKMSNEQLVDLCVQIQRDRRYHHHHHRGRDLRRRAARFFTYLTLGYAAATVQICACAVAAVHRLNGYDCPLTAALKSLLKAISAVGMCGTRCKKLIVDGSFIVAMCSNFLEEYPVFDAERFDPTVLVRSDEDRSIMWLRAVAKILLGLEIGARAGEITRMRVCCWQARDDGSVMYWCIWLKMARMANYQVQC